MATRGSFYSGTSNIVLPVAKKDFPEDYRNTSRLRYYSSLFNSLEVNSSFYKVPRHDTFQKWANDVPDNFRFTVKLWREITHQRQLSCNSTAIDMFMLAAHGIGHKKGCLLVQFPASITAAHHNAVGEILQRIKKKNIAPKWKVCVEFRHTSWYDTIETTTLLKQCDASLTGHDMPKSKTLPKTNKRTMNLRFHGVAGDYRGSYTPEALHNYAGLITEWLDNGNDVYAYFNNTLGEAFNNARHLQETVEALQQHTSALPSTIHH